MERFEERSRPRNVDDFNHANRRVLQDEAAYGRVRRQTYGQNAGIIPSGAPARDYELYSTNRTETSASKSQYNEDRRLLRDEFDTLPHDQQTYYENNTRNLLPRHHGRLLPAAHDVEAASYRHATTRADFYENHPVAYSSARKKETHRRLVQRAYGTHGVALDTYNTHGRYAPDPNSSARDIYDQEVPARWTPVPAGSLPDGRYGENFVYQEIAPRESIQEIAPRRSGSSGFGREPIKFSFSSRK